MRKTVQFLLDSPVSGTDDAHRQVRAISASALEQPLRNQIHRELMNRPLQFQKRSQYFFGANDETLSVAMRVHDPDRSPFNIET
jgi:hypothetical protein